MEGAERLPRHAHGDSGRDEEEGLNACEDALAYLH